MTQDQHQCCRRRVQLHVASANSIFAGKDLMLSGASMGVADGRSLVKRIVKLSHDAVIAAACMSSARTVSRSP